MLSGATVTTYGQLLVTPGTRESKRKSWRLLSLVSYGRFSSKICSDIITCHTGLDVFVLAPTGMGKVCVWFSKRTPKVVSYILLYLQSLCFQIPAVADKVYFQNHHLAGADFIAVWNHHRCFTTIGSVEHANRNLYNELTSQFSPDEKSCVRCLFVFLCQTGLHFVEVSSLRRKGLPAVSLTSETPSDERNQVLLFPLLCL